MLNLQNLKSLVIIKQEAATNAATLTSDIVDTLGFREALFQVFATTSNNATNNPSVLRILESDATVVSNATAVAALTGDGASGFTIPSSPTSTTTAPFAYIHVDVRKRKRYLWLDISPVTTQTVTVNVLLARAEQMPNSITEMNVAVAANG